MTDFDRKMLCEKFTACAHPLSCHPAGYCLEKYPTGYLTAQRQAATPVRTVTRKEIVPGTYGPDARLSIETRDGEQSETYIDLIDGWYKADQIREFARLLNEIADAMEDGE